MLYSFNHIPSVIVILPVLSTVRSRHHVFFLPSTVPDMLQFAHSLRLIVRATQLAMRSSPHPNKRRSGGIRQNIAIANINKLNSCGRLPKIVQILDVEDRSNS